MSDRPFAERTNDRRVFFWLVVGLVVIFGGLYVAGYVVTSDKIPRGTTVAGVHVGGVTPATAETKLARALQPRSAERIVVSAAGRRSALDPAQAGLGVDVHASVAQVGGGRSWRPDRMWDFFTGGDDYEAVTTVDRAKLDAAIARLAATVDRPAKNGSVGFVDGEAVPGDATAGRALDRAGAYAAIRHAYLDTDGPVPLEVQTVQPDISERDVLQAMDEFANPATAAPVILEMGTNSVVLQPEDYTPALSMEPADGALAAKLDDDTLITALVRAMHVTTSAPRNATVRIVDGRPRVIPAKNGVTFDRKQVTGGFLDVVVADGADRTLKVRSVVAKPTFSTAQARKLGIVEQVSSFTTYFPHADYRNTNLGRAAELINNTVLRPGQTFSLNGVVGERTRKNGFTKGFIISDGVFKEDFGGGVSQVATTSFNAAFFAGLEDVEHKPHSFYIDRYPVGREATVAWPSVDLKFRDDTPYGVLVQAWIRPSTPSRQGEMHVRMWSTKVWDITTRTSERYNLTEPATRRLHGDECVPNVGYGGFDIDVYRTFRRPGSDKVDHEEKFHTHYTPSDTVVCS